MPDFSWTTKDLVSSAKIQNSNFSEKYTKSKISKNFTKQENIRIRICRIKNRLKSLYKKENFKPEIKPMIENLRDELCQLESEYVKGA